MYQKLIDRLCEIAKVAGWAARDLDPEVDEHDRLKSARKSVDKIRALAEEAQQELERAEIKACTQALGRGLLRALEQARRDEMGGA